MRNLPIVFYTSYTSLQTVHESSVFSTFFPTLVFYLFSDKTDILTGVRWCIFVILIGISLMINEVEHLFYADAGSVCLLWENVNIFCPSFKWVICLLILNCMSYLYILDINPLLELSLVKISHSVCYLFVLLLASFTVQKLLSTRSSYLFFLEETFFKKYC